MSQTPRMRWWPVLPAGGGAGVGTSPEGGVPPQLGERKGGGWGGARGGGLGGGQPLGVAKEGEGGGGGVEGGAGEGLGGVPTIAGDEVAERRGGVDGGEVPGEVVGGAGGELGGGQEPLRGSSSWAKRAMPPAQILVSAGPAAGKFL